MTYETALSLFYLLAIPAIVLLAYRQYNRAKQKAADMKDNPFAYEVDKKSGEILFADEKAAVQAERELNIILDGSLEDSASDISMIDVLAPDDEDLVELSDGNTDRKHLEETIS